jgi:hypothetical protein
MGIISAMIMGYGVREWSIILAIKLFVSASPQILAKLPWGIEWSIILAIKPSNTGPKWSIILANEDWAEIDYDQAHYCWLVSGTHTQYVWT